MRQTLASLRRLRAASVLLAVLVAILIVGGTSHVVGQTTSTGWRLVAWNNLGMHCMDADFSVFSILPPYNTIQAQLVNTAGQLTNSASGVSVTYQAVADPAGSINSTSAGKTNFWSYVSMLFGAALPVDVGLLNHNMPGSANAPQPMAFDSTYNWFIAEGIPITPFDNTGAKNYYPMMRVTAKDSSGSTLATTDIVLPVSDEMSCTTCHASSSNDLAARPAAGWVNDPNREHDYRLNILRLHDDRQLGSAAFGSALAAKGYSSSGLYATAMGGKSILCASCHKSEALAGSGMTGIPPLTSSIHSLHASVTDPTNGQTLNSSANRSACYRCHPGSETRCLRGVMGNSVAADGSMAIQCQNCHGAMSAVGSPSRTGWLQEPACQNCHTGTAVTNSGAIRFTSTLDSTGQFRTPADTTFATNDNTPAAGYSLYRFSAGHGGLQCSACHGSTHAEYPSSHLNDNQQSLAAQGHVGTIAECSTCHSTTPSTVTGGPHGMHPVGQAWVSGHPGAAQSNRTQCQTCHGIDYRGTVLSRSFAARTLSTSFGTKPLFRGAQVGCYMCHNGPSSDSGNSNRAPVASNLTASTAAGVAVNIALKATDADGNALTYRIVSQPANGTVGLSGATATYYPYAGFTGTDSFTYAAWDGSVDSNLATVTLQVGSGGGTTPCSLTSTAAAPGTALVGSAVTFSASATPSNCTGSVAYDWNFGDGSAHGTTQTASHVYTSAGSFTWTMTASIGGVTSSKSGTIAVSSTSTSSCSLTTTATVPGTGTAGVAVSLTASASPTNCSGSVVYDWNFGDGTTHGTTQTVSHVYANAGTYTWTMTATISGVTSSRSGSIVIASPSLAPSISSVRALSDPFRIQINGANYQTGVKVYIGGSTTAWPYVQRVSSSQLILSGEGLRDRFPVGTAVTIKVVNPDGKYATTRFTRTSSY